MVAWAWPPETSALRVRTGIKTRASLPPGLTYVSRKCFSGHQEIKHKKQGEGRVVGTPLQDCLPPHG